MSGPLSRKQPRAWQTFKWTDPPPLEVYGWLRQCSTTCLYTQKAYTGDPVLMWGACFLAWSAPHHTVPCHTMPYKFPCKNYGGGRNQSNYGATPARVRWGDNLDPKSIFFECGMQFKMKVVSLIRMMLDFPWLSTIPHPAKACFLAGQAPLHSFHSLKTGSPLIQVLPVHKFFDTSAWSGVQNGCKYQSFKSTCIML